MNVRLLVIVSWFIVVGLVLVKIVVCMVVVDDNFSIGGVCCMFFLSVLCNVVVSELWMLEFGL